MAGLGLGPGAVLGLRIEISYLIINIFTRINHGRPWPWSWGSGGPDRARQWGDRLPSPPLRRLPRAQGEEDWRWNWCQVICKTSKPLKVANITTTTMAVGRASTASNLQCRTFDQVRQPFVPDHLHQVAVIVAKDYVDTNSPVKWVKPNQWQRKTAQVSYVLPSPI